MDARVERSTAPGDVLGKDRNAFPIVAGSSFRRSTRDGCAPSNRNRRGYYSFIIFTALFLITLFAEFIANDKPFLVKYDGAYYTPIFKMYTEKQFGGEFETEADYRDPEVKRLIEEKGGWMVWPLIPYSYRTIKLDCPCLRPRRPRGKIGSEPTTRAATCSRA